MTTRRDAPASFGVVLVLAGTAAFLVGCGGSSSDHNFGTFVVTDGTTVVNGVELPHKATLRFSGPDKLARFRLSLDSASIRVEGDAKVTGVEAEFEVRERTPGDASLVGTADSVVTKSAGGNPVLVVKATIRIAPSTPLDVATANGSVTVSGIEDASSVVARTDSGGIELRDLSRVATVSGRSSNGKVAFADGVGLGDLTLSTDSGAASAEGIQSAKSVTLTSSHGAVKVLAVNASESLTARTDSGSVVVEDVRTGRATLRSSYGSVTAVRSSFDHVDAHTDSGSVNLRSCKYKTKRLGTDYGSVNEAE